MNDLSMARPTTKDELLDRMQTEMQLLHDAVTSLDMEDRLAPGACDDWSVKDLLAHLAAWHEMFLGWEEAGAAGEEPEMPAPGFGWADTPALNEAIWRRTNGDEFEDVAKRFHTSYEAVRKVIESYADEDLFTKRRYRWTGSTSVGSYSVSATSSHYEWARKLIVKYTRTLDD